MKPLPPQSSNLRSPRWLVLGLAIIAFLAAASAARAYSVPEAIRAGYISVSGYASSSYSEATLTVKVLVSSSVNVDFSLAWLVQANDTQRVGLTFEKSTGAYNLRLAARTTYTLRFDSRCLDLNRHAPVTGTAFSQFYGINTSTFATIINALRANYGQSSVWSITDASTALSANWKNADPRPPVGVTTTSSSTLDLSGSTSWNTSGSQVNIVVGKVANISNSGTSGSLRLRLWATSSRYTGGSINGYVLGTHSLSPLQHGYYYSNISGYVAYTRPPSGYFYTTITLEEYSGSAWYIKDYSTFSSTTHF